MGKVPKCDDCLKILGIDDLNNANCLQCEFPISVSNRLLILESAGLLDDDRPPEIQGESKTKPKELQVLLCNNCGYTLTPEEMDSGEDCPVCEKNPRESPRPPEISSGGAGIKEIMQEEPIEFDGYDDDNDIELGEIEVSDTEEIINNSIKTPKDSTEISNGNLLDIAQDFDSIPKDTEDTIEIIRDEWVELEIVIGPNKGNILRLPQNKPLGRFDFKNALPSAINTPFAYISKEHMKFLWDKERLVIFDLGSTNGTKINQDELVEDIARYINKNDRIIIGDGSAVFRVIKYSQIEEDIFYSSYILKDSKYGIIYPLDISKSKSEIIGREPKGNNKSHPFLMDVHWHRIAIGEEVKRVQDDFSRISRRQFKLEYRFDDGNPKWLITNLSTKGTYVNDTFLEIVDETIEIEKQAKIKIGKNFECVLEEHFL